MPNEKYSIAQARDKLAKLVHTAESGTPVELTRRGELVAMIVSVADWRRMTGESPSFWQACEAFRTAHDVAELAIEPDVFEGVRDESPGRRVVL